MPRLALSSPRPVPRGLAARGPALLSYGFRPFFLAAGVFAFLAMTLWIVALSFELPIGGSLGSLNWHAHEMLFGYATAALAGFLLTAIPNWTGRLPVSGPPLAALFSLWLAGRIAMAVPDLTGVTVAAAIDAMFLPVLAAVALREVVAGRNWRNLKVSLGLMGLAGANVAFQIAATNGGDTGLAIRSTVSIYMLLIALVGGRIVPSFTRNWLAKVGEIRVPKPFGTYDKASVVTLAVALATWMFAPEGALTALLAVVAALLNLGRLGRWRGWHVVEEPLAAHAPHRLSLHSARHVRCRAGGAGRDRRAVSAPCDDGGRHRCMTLAVMTRASLSHTGRRAEASIPSGLSFGALLMAAVVRPFAELLPESYHLLLSMSGLAWLAAFGLFVIEYMPMLAGPVVRERRA